MKKLIFSSGLLTLLLSATAASAHSHILDGLADLPALTGVQVIVSTPSPLTPVQPYGEISFTYASCWERDFSVTVEEQDGVMFVRVTDEDLSDCRAMDVEREYRLQISSDMSSRARVVVLNPIAYTRK